MKKDQAELILQDINQHPYSTCLQALITIAQYAKKPLSKVGINSLHLKK